MKSAHCGSSSPSGPLNRLNSRPFIVLKKKFAGSLVREHRGISCGYWYCLTVISSSFTIYKKLWAGRCSLCHFYFLRVNENNVDEIFFLVAWHKLCMGSFENWLFFGRSSFFPSLIFLVCKRVLTTMPMPVHTHT